MQNALFVHHVICTACESQSSSQADCLISPLAPPLEHADENADADVGVAADVTRPADADADANAVADANAAEDTVVNIDAHLDAAST